jgi:serine/threonine protein kinase
VTAKMTAPVLGGPVDRLTFFGRLRDSRLLGTAQLADVAARFPAGVPAHAFAAALVADGTLTRFQAQRLWAGQLKGLVLGQYRIQDELGKGGFGRVYKAVHGLMGRVVALKVIAPELVEDRRARDWFKREVRAATQLGHPNIVLAYDADEVDDVLFLAMEFVDGPSLDALVRKQGPLPPGLACEMMRQAALALQYAHEKGIVHRDIKPANLLLQRKSEIGNPKSEIRNPKSETAGSDFEVKVVDFGLARLQGAAFQSQTIQLQSSKSFVGTPDFVSPEQARDVHSVDIRSDLYSLGCTFYFALSGQRPFKGSTVLETVVKHMQEEARPLTALRAELPPAVAAVVSRLMAKEPAERFQTPTALVEALTPLCDCDGRLVLGGAAAYHPSVPAARGPDEPAEGPAELPATALVPDLAFWSGPEGNAATVVTSQTPPVQICAVRPVPEAPPIENVEQAASPSPLPNNSPQFSADLRQVWRQWLALVERIAEGAEQVPDTAYRTLHSRLLSICRAELPAAQGAGREVLQRLEMLTEPWLTPHALATTDQEALAGLLLACRQLDQELGGRSGLLSLLRWPLLLGSLFLGLVLAAWLCRQLAGMLSVRGEAASLWQLVRTHPLPATAIALPLLVGLAIFLFARLSRR